MNKVKYIAVVAAMVLASGCASNGKVNDLEARVAAAETQLIVLQMLKRKLPQMLQWQNPAKHCQLLMMQ